MVASDNVSRQKLLNWISFWSETIVSTVRRDNFLASAADILVFVKLHFNYHYG